MLRRAALATAVLLTGLASGAPVVAQTDPGTCGAGPEERAAPDDRPRVEVTRKRYGARPDDEQDDRAALIRARDRAREIGGAVYLPAGQYVLADDVLMDVDMVGDGPRKTVISCRSDNIPFGQRCLRIWPQFSVSADACLSGSCALSGGACDSDADCRENACGNRTGASCRAEQVSDPPVSRWSLLESQPAGLDYVTLDLQPTRVCSVKHGCHPTPETNATLADWDVGDWVAVSAGKNPYDADDALWRVTRIARIVDIDRCEDPQGDCTGRIYLDRTLDQDLDDDGFRPGHCETDPTRDCRTRSDCDGDACVDVGRFYGRGDQPVEDALYYERGRAYRRGDVVYQWGVCSEDGETRCERDAECRESCRTPVPGCVGTSCMGLYEVTVESCTATGRTVRSDATCHFVPRVSNLGLLWDCEAHEGDSAADRQLATICGRKDHRPVLQRIEGPAHDITWRDFTLRYDGEDPGVTAVMVKAATAIRLEQIHVETPGPHPCGAFLVADGADVSIDRPAMISTTPSGTRTTFVGGWNSEVRLTGAKCVLRGGKQPPIVGESYMRLSIDGSSFNVLDRTPWLAKGLGGLDLSLTDTTTSGFDEVLRAHPASGDPMYSFDRIGIERNDSEDPARYLGRLTRLDGNEVSLAGAGPRAYGRTSDTVWSGNRYRITLFEDGQPMAEIDFDGQGTRVVRRRFQVRPGQRAEDTLTVLPWGQDGVPTAGRAILLEFRATWEAPGNGEIEVQALRATGPDAGGQWVPHQVFGPAQRVGTLELSAAEPRGRARDGDGAHPRLFRADAGDALAYAWDSVVSGPPCCVGEGCTCGEVELAFTLLIDPDTAVSEGSTSTDAPAP